LRRDVETGKWNWHKEAIEEAGITDNVARFLTHRLSKLPPALRRVIETAACIGSRFDLELLTHLLDQPQEELRNVLDDAVREGLLLYEEGAGDGAYAFVHDRVQEAAYEGRSPEERLASHLWIGRRLRARHGERYGDDELFAMLYHRNRAFLLL